MADIAALLSASRAAHEQYKVNRPRMIPDGVGGVKPSKGDPVEARRALLEAKRLRDEARAADPTKSDPAWAAESVPDSEMQDYYALVAK